MNELTRREDHSPIRGWNIDANGLVATTRWNLSWPMAYVIAAIWNIGMPRMPFNKPPPPSFMLVSEIAAFVFTLLALRAFFAQTTIRFSAKELTVGNPFAPWQRYRIDVAEIKGFQLMQHEPQGHTDVGVELLSGVVQPLPIDWQPVTLSWNRSRKRIFLAPASSAQWVANALNEMLAKARLIGHDTYRS